VIKAHSQIDISRASSIELMLYIKTSGCEFIIAQPTDFLHFTRVSLPYQPCLSFALHFQHRGFPNSWNAGPWFPKPWLPSLHLTRLSCSKRYPSNTPPCDNLFPTPATRSRAILTVALVLPVPLEPHFNLEDMSADMSPLNSSPSTAKSSIFSLAETQLSSSTTSPTTSTNQKRTPDVHDIKVPQKRRKLMGRPKNVWTPSRRRKLVRLYLLSNLEVDEISKVLQADGFNPW
jgi:hypothetical protein